MWPEPCYHLPVWPACLPGLVLFSCSATPSVSCVLASYAQRGLFGDANSNAAATVTVTARLLGLLAACLHLANQPRLQLENRPLANVIDSRSCRVNIFFSALYVVFVFFSPVVVVTPPLRLVQLACHRQAR